MARQFSAFSIGFHSLVYHIVLLLFQLYLLCHISSSFAIYLDLEIMALPQSLAKKNI